MIPAHVKLVLTTKKKVNEIIFFGTPFPGHAVAWEITILAGCGGANVLPADGTRLLLQTLLS